MVKKLVISGIIVVIIIVVGGILFYNFKYKEDLLKKRAEVLPLAEIKNYKDVPTLFIDGERQIPLLTGMRFMGIPEYSNPPESVDTAFEQIKKAVNSGIHIHSVENFIADERWETGGVIIDSSWNDIFNQKILEADPEGYIITRFWVPLYGAGRTEIDSRIGRQAGKKAIEEYLDHIMASPYADRVIGFHIIQCENGEWRICKPGVEGFKIWLKEKYGTNKALQEAWNDNSVTFSNAQEVSLTPPKSGVNLYNPTEDAAILDYKFYKNEIVVETIDYFGGVIKDKTNGKSLVVTFYGGNKYVHHKEDWFAYNKLLKSDNIDLFACGMGYTQRGPGQAGSYGTYQDSILLNDKLCVGEEDTRTYLSTEGGFGYIDHINTPEETINIMRRNFGRMLMLNSGTWYFDLLGTGWWNSDELWQDIGNYKQTYNQKFENLDSLEFRPEVAVIFDEKSSQFAYPPIKTRHNSRMPEHFNKVGVSIGYYLLDDLSKIPDSVKVYFFLNAFYLTDEQISSINAIKKNGNTLVWLYAPGYISDKGFNVDGVSQLTNINMGVDDTLYSRIIEITNNNHEITKNLPLNYIFGSYNLGGESIPQSRRATYASRITASFKKPLIHIKESRSDNLEILGQSYGENPKNVFGIKRNDNWNSIFIGIPELFSDVLPNNYVEEDMIILLRNIIKYGGVHIYLDSNDPTAISERYIMVHASQEGDKKITLKQNSNIYDALTGDLLFENTKTFNTYFQFGQTKIYYIEPV